MRVKKEKKFVNGIIPVNKPIGLTSHDVVAKIRRIMKIRRVGHTGTLDPMAEGVLPVCIGNATKVSDMLTISDKRYTAELILGMTTDTLDAEGEILSECAVTCSENDIAKAILSFVGELEQVPPMYSAVKQNGKKLYELARGGKTAERKPRRITVYNINIVKIDLEKPAAVIDVSCSKGTYIRTLCEDIGVKLGVGAYLNALTRTKSAGFDISECITLDELEKLYESGCAEEAVIPTDRIFENYSAVVLNEKQSERITNGVFVSCVGIKENQIYRVYDSNYRFLCIAQCREQRLHVVKSFWC